MSNWKRVDLVRKGLTHIRDGTNCQDSICVDENDLVLTAALADGLGSLRYAEFAAQAATQAVCDYFVSSRRFSGGIKEEVIPSGESVLAYVKDAVFERARESGISVEEMDCTLAFVCISKVDQYALVGLVGDSAICVIGRKESVVLNGGDKTANGTHTILDRDAAEHFAIKQINLDSEGVLGFILTSDGLDNELYMKGSTRIQRVAALYFNAIMKPEAKAVIQERIEKITSVQDTPFDDDISIAILSRAESEIELPVDPTWLCSCGNRNPLQRTYCRSCHMDFVKLYKAIRFSEYGGKAAFFASINSRPSEERKLVGLPIIEPEQRAQEKRSYPSPKTVSNQEPEPELPATKNHTVSGTENQTRGSIPGQHISWDTFKGKVDQSDQNQTEDNNAALRDRYAQVHQNSNRKTIVKLSHILSAAAVLAVIGIGISIGIARGKHQRNTELEGELDRARQFNITLQERINQAQQDNDALQDRIKQIQQENDALWDRIEQIQQENESELQKEYERGVEAGRQEVRSDAGGVPFESDSLQIGDPEQFVIAVGQSGSLVTFVQERLNSKGWNLDTDGVFGELTEAAVKEFQELNQLPSTGKVDLLTYWTMMNEQSVGVSAGRKGPFGNADGILDQIE